MSVFRPAAKVASPDGREWEIYAYRVRWEKPPRFRDVWRSVVAAWRAARSDDWTVDAISYMPQETVYRWTTRTEHKGQVLAQVEGHLARGDVAQRLPNAVYRGERRSAR
ncbi:MAG TPA: hypothetical protein VKA21_12020 [Candidatus Binatia bacterium]|nr:hypothetical protein [Candidatus Binatia bacterium]